MADEFTPLDIREKSTLLRSGLPPSLVREYERDRTALFQEQETKKVEQQLAQEFEPISEEEATQIVEQREKGAPSAEEYEEVDPVSIWDAKTLAKDKEFSLEQYISRNPEALNDSRKKKLAEVWREINKEPITAGDVALGVVKLPWSTVKAVGRFLKGTGQTIYDVASEPISEASRDIGVSGVLQKIPVVERLISDESQEKKFTERRQESEKKLVEDLAGLEKGTFEFARFAKRMTTTLPRKFGVSSWDELSSDQLEHEFTTHFSEYLQSEAIGRGEGEFSQAIADETLKEIRERGEELDPERVATVAEADPVGFFMFGKAFEGAFAGAKALKQGAAGVAGKTAVVQEARNLSQTRQMLSNVRNTLPPHEPVRKLADDLLKAATERTGKGAQALEKVFQASNAASRVVGASAKLRNAEADLTRFAGSAERQTAVLTARAELQAAEAAAKETLGARGLAAVQNGFGRVAPESSASAGRAVVGAGAKAVEIGGRLASKALQRFPGVATAAAALGSVATGSIYQGLAILSGGRLFGRALRTSGKALGYPFRKIEQAGKTLGKTVGAEAPETAFQKGIRGAVNGSSEVVAEALKATPIDVGFGLLLAETPEDVQNIAGYAGAFRALHAAGRPLARFVQNVKGGPQATQRFYLTRKAGNVKEAAQADRAFRRTLSEEQRTQLTATEKFLRDVGSEAPVYVLDGATFERTLIDQFRKQNSREPNVQELADIQNYSQQRGMFAEEVIGDRGERGSAIFVTAPEAITHESAHSFQQVLGPRGNEVVDRIIYDEFAPQWEQIGTEYASRLTGREVGDWRQAIEPIIPEGIKQQALGEPKAAADIYLAREIAAEQFATLFEATGGQPLAKTSLTEKLATVVDRTASFFGVNLMEGGPTTPGLGLEVSGRTQDALRTAGREQVETAADAARFPAVAPEPTAPAPRPGEPAAPAPRPGEPTAPAPRPGEPAAPVAPVEPARNIRDITTTEGLRAEAPERLNTELAREKLPDIESPEARQAVNDIITALERAPGEPIVLNLENLSVIPGTNKSAVKRSLRRAEQEIPDAAREFFSKRLAVTRFISDQFSGGKLQVQAMSMDKVLANAIELHEQLKKANASELSPYETAPETGMMTEKGWQDFQSDLISYTSNQANGYRGGGKEIIPVEGGESLGLAIPEVNPNYRPTPLSNHVEQFLNVVQGVPIPKTAREFKGVVPGNVKGQVLREAQGEETVAPSIEIQPRKGLQTFKSFPDRQVQEVNPLRRDMNDRGVDTSDLIEVTERLNVERLKNVKVEPDLRFNLPVTDVIRGGFLPGKASGDTVRLFRGQEGTSDAASGVWYTRNPQKAASFSTGGRVFEVEVPLGVAAEGKRRAEQQGQGGDTVILRPEEALNPRPVEVKTPTFQLLPQEFVKGDKVDLTSLRSMPQEQFVELTKTYKGELGGGLTGLAFDLGAKVKTTEEVQALRDLYDESQATSAKAKAAMDLDTMFQEVVRGQFIRETLETATGEGGSESFIKNNVDPNFESPMKSAAKSEEPANTGSGSFLPKLKEGQQEFVIHGRAAGEFVQEILPAKDSKDARDKAVKRGITVSRVEEVPKAETPAELKIGPLLPKKDSVSKTKSGKDQTSLPAINVNPNSDGGVSITINPRGE